MDVEDGEKDAIERVSSNFAASDGNRGWQLTSCLKCVRQNIQCGKAKAQAQLEDEP